MLAIRILALIICVAVPISLNTVILNPLDAYFINPTVANAKLAINYVADEYQIDRKIMTDVIKCESNFDWQAKNPESSASGLCQFINQTWNTYCEGDKKNPVDQLVCMAQMMQNGRIYHWVCYRGL